MKKIILPSKNLEIDKVGPYDKNAKPGTSQEKSMEQKVMALLVELEVFRPETCKLRR